MWKANWAQTRQHFGNWWNHTGLVVGKWGSVSADRDVHAAAGAPPPAPATPQARACSAEFRAADNHYQLARAVFPLDTLPLAYTNMGPGSLAAMLGSTPEFYPNTVWFPPVFADVDEPEQLPPLRFDADNEWWRVTEDYLRACVARSGGNYLVPIPDLCEHADILASLRGPENLCVDLLERPAWVEQKITEINAAWLEVYNRVYDLVRQPDGSSAFCAFYLWGPGRTAKLQCDLSAMLSGEMFRRFVVPALEWQCARLDQTLYHLDGTQALHHLDALLAIDGLDAIEWTPQAGIEQGGHPRWYELYRRILAAGKSVQIVGAETAELAPLLDAIGPRGVYVITPMRDEREAEQVARIVEPYYP
ncbi:MAG: hypothetical protein LBK76_00305 [Verrucomicrobiales bacterium]|jgi:hypothetical protein|nr:hypothetical protein [Verrucomicrobiales bacterium]